METRKFNLDLILYCTIIFLCPSYSVSANKTYFDLSQNEINIRTDFTGKEIILFGLVEPNHEVIVIVKGPKKNITIRNKNRVLGFWFNTKGVVYIDVPSVYLISSSRKIDEILNQKEIFENQLSFESIKLIPKEQKNLFVDLSNWNKSLIRVQKQNNLYKQFKLDIIDGKLFQTRLYFPSNIPTGIYDVQIYQIKDKKIYSSSIKTVNVDKSGIGNSIYIFAMENSILYALVTILLAIVIGIGGAMIFRKL